MRGADDEVTFARQVAVGEEGQGKAGMRTAVDEASHLAAGAYHEAGEYMFADPKREAARAGLGYVRQGAERDAGGGSGRVQFQGTTTRQGRISMLWKRSTAV